MPLEIKDFGGQEGGGDFDSAPHKVEPHKWVNLENMRVLTTDAGEIGNVESIGSNVLINNPNLPAGNNTQIGSIIDEEDSVIIYFLYNDQGNHSIFAYNVVTETIQLVLLSSQLTGGLNFSKTSIIHSGFYANGCAYWTDNLNEPRKLNIDAGIALNNPQNNQQQLAITDNQTTISGYIVNTYGLPPSPSQGYGIQIYGQLIRTGTSGQFAAATILPFFIDWSLYPAQTAAQVVASALFEYFLTLGGTEGLDWTIFGTASTVVININPTWNFGTGDPLFAPMVSLQLQLFSVTTIPYTAPLDISIISWIKRQPGLPPVIQKITQTIPSVVDDLIGNDAMEFCYRYVYRDYETGTLSGLSPIAPYNFLSDTYNAIQINIPLLEVIQQDVIQIDLIVRYFAVAGNTSFIIKSWRTSVATDATEINQHNIGAQPLNYTFYNGQTGIALDPAYAIKPYDIVPLLAGTVEWGKNRAFMGDNLLGYNPPTLTSLRLQQIPAIPSSTPSGEWFLLKFSAIYSYTLIRDQLPRILSYYVIYVTGYGYYYFTNPATRPTVLPLPAIIDYSLLTFLGLNLSTVMYNIAFNNPPSVNVPIAISSTMLQYVDQGVSIAITNFPVTNPATTIIQGLNLFKSASPYSGGVVFFDYYGRKCGVVTDSGIGFTTPELKYDNSSFTKEVLWTLSNSNAVNEIMEDAYYFAPVLTLNLRTRFFLQARVSDASYCVKDYNNNFVIQAAYNFIGVAPVNIIYSASAAAIATGQVIFSNVNLPGELFVGQRIRVGNPSFSNYMEGWITSIDTVGLTVTVQVDTILGTGSIAIPTFQFVQLTYCSFNISSVIGFGLGYVFTQGDVMKIYTATGNLVYSLQVFGQVGSWVVTEFVDLGDLSDTLHDNRNFLFELYTPYNPSLTEPYYEQGQIFPISNPTTPNRMYSVIAGYFSGDVYIIKRSSTEANSLVSQPVSYITENMSPNDMFWKNWFTNAGRPNYIDYIGQKLLTTAIEISETLVDDARSNGLSTFDGTESVVYPECGAITKLILTSKVHGQQGTIMLAICTQETVSLYLSEVQLVGSTDDVAVTQATNIIGTINTLKGSFGSNRPESVVQFRGNVFFWSDNNEKIVQYSESGLFPVSNYKMTVFWKLFSDLYNSMTQAQIAALGSQPFVFGGVDPHNWELLMTVPKLSSTPPYGYLPDYPGMIYPFDIWDAQNKTAVFKLSADPNFWIGAYNITAEGWATVQNKLFAFKNGNIYQCNSTASFGNFFGTQYQSRIMFVANQLPNKPKVYERIATDANMRPTLTYFRTEPTLSPTEQYDLWEQASDLMDFDYKAKEGELYAVLYRNKLVPTQSGLLFTGLLTAEKIRALTLKVMVAFSPTNVPVELRYVSMGYDPSKGHNLR